MTEDGEKDQDVKDTLENGKRPEDPEEKETGLQKFRGFLEDATESIIFASRWVLAPVFLGLALALLALAVNFIIQLIHYIPEFPFMTVDEIATAVLSLIDIALLGNLLLIVIFSGYENFVSKINPAMDHEDRPEWMGTLDFSGLKIKIVGSVVAISLVELLQDFIHLAESDDHSQVLLDGGEINTTYIIWRILLHLTFAVSGVLFAFMDLIAEKRHIYLPGHRKDNSKGKAAEQSEESEVSENNDD